MQEALHVLYTEEEILNLIEVFKDKDYIAVDSETTGLELDAEVVGLSIASEPDEGFYVVTAIWDKESQQLIRLENREAVVKLLDFLLTKNLIMHNNTVDVQWLHRNYGVFLMPALHTDTMGLAHLLDENRKIGLKELGYTEFGEESKKEQQEMKESVIANKGIWEEKKGGNKEMYKADSFIMGKYGAKDAILTIKIFYRYVDQLFERGLDNFFYEETMPLFRGPTYHLNTTGLKVDTVYLDQLEKDLVKEINDLKTSILFDINPYVKEEYPGTNKKNSFNIGSSSQLAWLMFIKLQNDWDKLTDRGREIAKETIGRLPYSKAQKRQFENAVKYYLTEKGKPVKLQSIVKCDKAALKPLQNKYDWVKNILKMKNSEKILKTYVVGIKKRLKYGVIHPSFMQCGTTSTRYSSRNPNFQNLPRDDKRVKRAIIARPGKVFVGADQDQLEVRVFASFAKDKELLAAIERGEDPYSIVGMRIFKKTDCVPFKEGRPDAFGVKYPKLRQIAKSVMLAATYGSTSFRLSEMLGMPSEECQTIINDYFKAFPDVEKFMLESHALAIENGVVYTHYGRPRHIPEAKVIKALGGSISHDDLPYEYRTLLNLGVNSRVQGTAGNVMNRCAIAFLIACDELGLKDVKIVMQIHDELIIECNEKDAELVKSLLQKSMEETCSLPGVKFRAKPKIAKNLAELK